MDTSTAFYYDRFISNNGIGWIFNNNMYELNSGKHWGWFVKVVLCVSVNRVITFLSLFYVTQLVTT